MKVNNTLITKKMDKKIMMLDGEHSLLYSLNETGTFIYEELKMGTAENKIIEKLTSQFSVTEKIASADYKNFIQELKKNKIIV